ncbi:NAD(P)/FAD-dependent oxidoreductase [Promicromonospora sukumoe]|uniref:NAD(P)/FAD-dependent oxidoreductase n=1 Tax=Promicromonospora sukumoe TaxID=88382 RepID=UPI00037B3A94|nr:FAD-dependent oxidoreductase [Promicromonospora sukumoe]
MGRLQQTVFERNVPARSVVDHALARTRQAVFWQDDLGTPDRYPRLSASARADVVVVGGGCTGLWTALGIKQRDPGARVLLLEGRSVGWAASGRDTGLVTAPLGHENLAAMDVAVTGLGLDCGWERTGVVDLAVEPHQIDQLQDAAVAAAVAGVPHTYLDRAKVRAEIASPTYEAGLVRPGGGALVDPARLAAELARAASALGVEIFEETRAVRLAVPARGAVALRTTSPAGEASVRAERVVLGTGAFPPLLRRHRRQAAAVYEHAVATEPLDAGLLAALGWRGRQGLADAAHRYRLTDDDRIVFGGYAVRPAGGRMSRAHENQPETARRLAEHLLTTFPQLEGVRLTHRWAAATARGVRTGPDRLAQPGALGPGRDT